MLTLSRKLHCPKVSLGGSSPSWPLNFQLGASCLLRPCCVFKSIAIKWKSWKIRLLTLSLSNQGHCLADVKSSRCQVQVQIQAQVTSESSHSLVQMSPFYKSLFKQHFSNRPFQIQRLSQTMSWTRPRQGPFKDSLKSCLEPDLDKTLSNSMTLSNHV